MLKEGYMKRRKLKKITISVCCMLFFILNVVSVSATPTYLGYYISGTMGLCPYYGLNIYPDIYNEMNSAFVEVNGAAGNYSVALWSSLAHSSANYDGEHGDGVNNIYTVAYTSRSYVAITHSIYNTKTNVLAEADINFNMRFPFGIDGSSSSFDLISVLTHELGHVVGLSHDTYDISAVMYENISKGEIRRTFNSQERTYLYNLYH